MVLIEDLNVELILLIAMQVDVVNWVENWHWNVKIGSLGAYRVRRHITIWYLSASPTPLLFILSPSPSPSPAVAGTSPMDCSSAISTKPVPPAPPNPSSADLPESPTPQRKIWIKPTAPASKKQQQQRRKKGSGWDEKRVVGFVDYDEGERRVSTEISGARKDEIPARYRLRVDGSRWQKDWKLSEVVDQVMRLRHWEDIDGVLNRWAGRFARKNFPLLIRVRLNSSPSFLFFFFAAGAEDSHVISWNLVHEYFLGGDYMVDCAIWNKCSIFEII